MIITVNVTQENIDCGKPGAPARCAIGLAISSLGFDDFGVLGTAIRINRKNYVVPERVSKFICDFDEQLAVTPMSFPIDVNEADLPDCLKPTLVTNYPVRVDRLVGVGEGLSNGE